MEQMGTTATRWTIDDFEQLPPELAGNHELVDGELVPVSGNIWVHNLLRDGIVTVQRPFVREHGLGMVASEQEFEFDGDAHAPDVTFVSRAQLPLIHPRKRVQRFAPDLAIEIVSPNDKFSEFITRKNRYLRCGTREVWILDQDSEELYVYSGRGQRILSGQDVLSTDLIPGFSITVDELFRLGRA